MSPVIPEHSRFILATTSSRINSVVLILLSMNLFLGAKAFGTAIGGEALEAGGNEYSSSSADQTTDWQWLTSTSIFDVDPNLIKRYLYDKGEWQFIRSEDKNLFSDTQTGHIYLEGVSAKGGDRFIPIEDLEDLSIEENVILYLSLIMFAIMIGTGAAFVWWLHNALAKQEKSAHRRKYRLRGRGRFPLHEKWPELKWSSVKRTFFHSKLFMPFQRSQEFPSVDRHQRSAKE